MIEIDFNKNNIVLWDYKKNNLCKAFSSYEGLYEWLKKELKKTTENSSNKEKINKILSIASSWINKNFQPGASAQCCNFVRHVFSSARIELEVTKNPSDGALPTGSGYANSLAGDDIGKKIETPEKLQPGDLVFFKNTYGSWPDGTITHIGIYYGDGYIIHRSTASKPVQKIKMSEYYGGSKFKEGRRVL